MAAEINWASADPLSVVAHELRGPVQALALSAELLADDLEMLDAPRRRAMVDGIRRRTLWLQVLLENLLAVGALRQGRLSLQREPVDLVGLLAELALVVEPLLASRGQRLRVRAGNGFGGAGAGKGGDTVGSEGARATLEVSADPLRLGQALLNLLLNASKFGALESDIDVTIDAPGNGPGDAPGDAPAEREASGARDGAEPSWVRVAVADRGPGLPAEHAHDPLRLFEPLVKAELPSPVATGPGSAGAGSLAGVAGLGLGLALVRSIVDAHGGRVGAEDRAGGGACFWLDLPRSPVGAGGGGAAHSGSPGTAPSGAGGLERGEEHRPAKGLGHHG